MALKAVNITIGQSLGEGRYSSSIKGSALPFPSLSTLNTAITTALTDITTALGAANATHDSTPEITTVQTDVTTVQTDVAALATAMTGDVAVVWDGSTITHRNQLRHALLVALRAVDAGYGSLAE